MVLLTSSTISVILSSGVVCMFTFLLFLSGYVLQQQSVRSIQGALHPPVSPLTIARPLVPRNRGDEDLLNNLNEASSNYGQNVMSDLGEGEDRPSPPQAAAERGNYAYLQLLSDPDPSNICSAILFFKQLSTSRTSIHDRLFMYPQDWDLMRAPPKPVSTALSLLRAASTKYDIWLLPIDMSIATASGYSATDSKVLRLGQIQFMQYDSVLYLRTPGLLLDAEKLDEVLSSRPLPLKHDKGRLESYRNEAWISMPLRPERDPDLPPVYLIAVNNMGDHFEARTHIPNVAIPGFGDLVTGPWGGDDPKAAYVFFERDEGGHARWEGNPLFGTWRAQQQEVCEGLDLDWNEGP